MKLGILGQKGRFRLRQIVDDENMHTVTKETVTFKADR